MKSPMIPSNYQEWHHCITVLCGQPLTAQYIEQRIHALNDASDHMTKKFIELYGKEQHTKTLQWFEQAKQNAK